MKYITRKTRRKRSKRRKTSRNNQHGGVDDFLVNDLPSFIDNFSTITDLVNNDLITEIHEDDVKDPNTYKSGGLYYLQMKSNRAANEYTKYQIFPPTGKKSYQMMLSPPRNKKSKKLDLDLSNIRYAYKINLVFQPKSMLELTKKQHPREYEKYINYMTEKELL